LKKTSTSHSPARFAPGSGNVFADLGIADSEIALAKARLAEEIQDVIEHRGLTQTEAASIVGIDQPSVSKVVKGRLDGFSQERLLRFLTALGVEVEILLRRRDDPETPGRLTVAVRRP
jgi:predicted XRE-type DNA-binding protein